MLKLFSKLQRIYRENIILMSALIGALLGFFVLAPVSMIVEHITHTGTEYLYDHLVDMITGRLPLWGIFFIMLGISVGTFFGWLQKRIIDIEEKMVHTQKLAALGRIVAGVAHELNTPLNNISLITESLKRKEKCSDCSEDLTSIASQIERASKIVSALTDFGKKRPLSTEKVNINETLQQAVQSVTAEKNRTEVKLVANYEKVPYILGDTFQIEQVFINILKNSFESIEKKGMIKGTITISTRYIKPEKMVEISIKDTGCGMEKEEIKKLFEPFYTTKDSGLGLGLAISYGIVQMHNGEIKVESKIGEGTTVRIYFPVR